VKSNSLQNVRGVEGEPVRHMAGYDRNSSQIKVFGLREPRRIGQRMGRVEGAGEGHDRKKLPGWRKKEETLIGKVVRT